MRLVQAQIHQAALQLFLNLDAGCIAHACNVFGVQVPRHVNITRLQQQALAGAFGNMAYDHAFHRGRAAVIIREGLQGHGFIRLPAYQTIGAGACRIGGQPGVAQIAVNLMLHRQLHIDNRTDSRCQAVQHERGRVALVGGDRQLVAIGLDGFCHVFRREAELRQDECGRLVQDHSAVERPFCIFRGDRIARLEFHPFAHGESDGFAVFGHFPAFRKIGHIALVVIQRIEIHQFAIDILVHVRASKFEALRRVHRRDVINPVRDDQHIGRRFGDSGDRCEAERDSHCRPGKCFRPNVHFTNLSVIVHVTGIRAGALGPPSFF